VLDTHLKLEETPRVEEARDETVGLGPAGLLQPAMKKIRFRSLSRSVITRLDSHGRSWDTVALWIQRRGNAQSGEDRGAHPR